MAADSTVDTIRDFNAWWLDASYQTVEDDEYESLFRLHNILTVGEINTIIAQDGPRLLSDDGLVAKLVNLKRGAAITARRRLESLSVDEFGVAVQIYNRDTPGITSVDQICTFGKRRLDRYIANILGVDALDDPNFWAGGEIHKRIVLGTALNKLEETINYLCENTGPSLESVREEKNILETLINPNE